MHFPPLLEYASSVVAILFFGYVLMVAAAELTRGLVDRSWRIWTWFMATRVGRMWQKKHAAAPAWLRTTNRIVWSIVCAGFLTVAALSLINSVPAGVIAHWNAVLPLPIRIVSVLLWSVLLGGGALWGTLDGLKAALETLPKNKPKRVHQGRRTKASSSQAASSG
jgi:hypothetical protein